MEMTRKEVADACVEVMKKHPDQCSAEYRIACVALRQFGLSGGQLETLRSLVEQGPVEDGNIPSKAARGDLFDMGLAGRACVKGEQGYAVANYRGWDVYTATVAAPIR